MGVLWLSWITEWCVSAGFGCGEGAGLFARLAGVEGVCVPLVAIEASPLVGKLPTAERYSGVAISTRGKCRLCNWRFKVAVEGVMGEVMVRGGVVGECSWCPVVGVEDCRCTMVDGWCCW